MPQFKYVMHPQEYSEDEWNNIRTSVFTKLSIKNLRNFYNSVCQTTNKKGSFMNWLRKLLRMKTGYKPPKYITREEFIEVLKDTGIGYQIGNDLRYDTIGINTKIELMDDEFANMKIRLQTLEKHLGIYFTHSEKDEYKKIKKGAK